METKMTLYHGSIFDFDAVSLAYSKDRRDFGKGFYTTTIQEQAQSWAHDLSIRFGAKTAYLYEFSFSTEDLSVKKFRELSEEWLLFISKNRVMGGVQHSYDAVIGPVADDRIYPTVARYLDGTYSVEETLRRLSFIKPNDQVSVHTEKAVKNLSLTGKQEWKS
jgi:hypothetical protein